MSDIKIENIVKKYGKVTALNDVTLEIKDREFFVLFGPAGAGKTTILKTIAGIEFPNEGFVYINDEIVNLVEPAKRNVAMAFENYALYPQFTVFDNIASPLRSRIYRKDEEFIKKRVVEVASTLKIDHLLDRLPSQLSNGQRQRVSLGRCMIREPNVFLMDEPLAHLDAKLRHFMRAELKEMQTNLNTTTIYVTHDYLEAMSLGDRIAIVNEGQIVQVGTSDEIYYTPTNEFVARIMGEPEINILPATVEGDKQALLSILDQGEKYALDADVEDKLKKEKIRAVHVAVRPSDIRFSKEHVDGYMKGKVYVLEPIGNKAVLTVDIKGILVRVIVPNSFEIDFDEDIYIQLLLDKAIFFDAKSEKYIYRHNEQYYIGRETM